MTTGGALHPCLQQRETAFSPRVGTRAGHGDWSGAGPGVAAPVAAGGGCGGAGAAASAAPGAGREPLPRAGAVGRESAGPGGIGRLSPLPRAAPAGSPLRRQPSLSPPALGFKLRDGARSPCPPLPRLAGAHGPGGPELLRRWCPREGARGRAGAVSHRGCPRSLLLLSPPGRSFVRCSRVRTRSN